MMKPSKEDVMGYYYNKNHTQTTRGKRAKRHGLQSQLGLTLASTSSSDHSGAPDHPYRAAPSPAPSAEFTASASAEEEEGEEEDMANCLILLAQGHHSRKVQEKAAYECKTCNRCFASFQALGGHRASHKKLRANINTDEKKSLTLAGVRDYRFNNTSTTLSLQLGYRDHHLYSNNNKSKVHDCSICGAEFSSGQALGGHMRRHRTFMNTAAAVLSAGNTRSPPESHEARKKRNILQLDLNLPAPEDHDHLHRDSSSFSLVSKEPVLFFSSTSALVDCHY